MKSNLNHLQIALEPHIPKSLVSDDEIALFRQIGQHLPLLSFGCFECFIGQEKGRVDFNIRLNQDFEEHNLSLDKKKFNILIPDRKLQSNFQPILNFLSKWKNKSLPIAPMMHHIWFIYDITSTKEKRILPWYYIVFRQNYFMRDGDFRVELVKQALRNLDFPQPEINEFVPIFKSLPASASISGIGIQKNRDLSFLRLYITVKNIDEIYNHLFQNHWPGNVAQLKEALGDYIAMASRIAFCIDYGHEPQAKIGIEIWYKEGLLERITEKMVNEKLCSPSLREGILSWEGSFEVDNNPNKWIWPKAFLDEKKTPPKKVKFTKNVPYIKFVYEEGKPLTCKAYLYFNRQF